MGSLLLADLTDIVGEIISPWSKDGLHFLSIIKDVVSPVVFSKAVLSLNSLNVNFRLEVEKLLVFHSAAGQYYIPYCGLRSQEEQNELWLRGRDSHGHIIDRKSVVTMKRSSKHVEGKALDVFALDEHYRDTWNPKYYISLVKSLGSSFFPNLRGAGSFEMSHIEGKI